MKKVISVLLVALFCAGCSYPELSMDEIKKLTGADDTETPIVKGVSIKYDSYTVYSDNNDDKIINKGEKVGLRVSLKNNGTSTANGVKATFSSGSSYVSGFIPTTAISYGIMAAGSSKSVDDEGYSYAGYTIQFTVSNSAPAGTQIPINISIVDESGNTWTDTFNVTVEGTKAQIAFDSYTVYSDNNGDKIINKGEKVGLRVSLKNNGTSTANGVKATFSSSSSYVSGFIPTTAISYGIMAAGSSKSVDDEGYSYAGYTIQFTVSNTTPAGTQIPINISIVDESGNTWTDTFYAVVGSETAEMAYDKYTVVADYDGDKKVEKGEQVYLQVFLKNIGSGAANSVKATFSSSSSYISGLSPTAQIDYGNFTGGQSKYGQGGYDFSVYYTIMFTVSSSATAGTQIPINISIVDGSSNTWSESFNVKVE